MWTIQIWSNLFTITRGLKEMRLPFRERIECACWEISQVEPQRNVKQHNPVLVKYSPICRAPFLWRQQHELAPEETGANALDCDDVASGDDDGGDDTASTWKPLTANQKRVIQNIHDNCGHPSREEFFTSCSSQSSTIRSFQLRATRV